MKYVRFQGLMPIRGSSSRRGIFQLAYKLKHSPEIHRYDDHELRQNLSWLEFHLNAPAVLDDREHFRAICWFKDDAREPLKRIWSIKILLEHYGYWIDVVKTRNPGRVIYEDGWQVAAKPFRSTSQR